MKNRILRFAVLLTLPVVLHLLLIHPASAAFTISEERKVGEQLLYTVRKAFPLLDDPDLVRYVTDHGAKVLDVAGLQYFDYRFYVIKSDEFNAFAAPSGLVFFYSGLISSMNSEDEFISVLAHEIGHVVKRHMASRIEKGAVIGAASLAMALAALALGGGAATQALLTGSMAAGQSANLHFSRKDEEEADLLAYGWMKKLNYNPEGQEEMLKTMRRISRYRSEKLPQYLLTHPNPEARLDYVQALLAADKSQGVTFTPKENFDFLRFKYRIMSQTGKTVPLRAYLAGVLSDARSSEHSAAMAKYGLSQVERYENNHARSLELLDEVISVFPGKAILQTDKGVALFGAGKYQEAAACLDRSFRSDGQDMYAALYLGKTYQALGQLDKAESYYKTVSYSMPEYSSVYFELGKTASIKNESGASSFYLGKYYLYEGKLKLAEFSLKNALEDKTISKEQQNECERLLETVQRLKDG